MPRASEREELIESVAIAHALGALFESKEMVDAEMESSGSSKSSSSSDSASDDEPVYFHILRELASARYLHKRKPIEKTSDNIRLLFDVYKEHKPVIFKAYMRVSPACFDALLAAVQDHEAFRGESNHKQLPVQTQLAIALYRFGHYGNAASVTKVALWAGVSYGMVINATKRVIFAFCSPEFRNRVMAFPNYNSPN